MKKNVLIYNSNLVITITSQLTLVVVALGITDMMAFSIRSFLVETIIFTGMTKSHRNWVRRKVKNRTSRQRLSTKSA